MGESITEEDKRKCNLIAENCEKLIEFAEKEVLTYKNDKNKLKEEVLKILEENQLVHNEIKNLKKSVIFDLNEEHKNLTNEAIDKLKGQVKCLQEERNTIYILWNTSKDTIKNLEKEIENYRDQIFKPNSITQVKQKYANTISLLENTVKCLRTELDKQVNLNREILNSKISLESNFNTSKLKLDEQNKKLIDLKSNESRLLNLKERLSTVMKVNMDLEKSLKIAKQIIDERFYREKEALTKIQEALQIAEIAITEKDEALGREIVIREECDSLAKTIGQVMEEAAQKVEKDVDQLKIRYDKEIEKINKEKNKIIKLYENQKKNTNLLEVRYQTVEKKLKEIVDENVSLDSNLQIASKKIIELELKLEAIECLMNNSTQNNKISEEREKEIQKYLLNNQQLKEKWKTAIDDVTKRFEAEISLLKNEKAILKAKNQEISVKLMQYE